MTPREHDERPWGSYTVLEEGPGWKVKRIDVKEGDVVITQGAGNIGRLAQELATMDFLQELAE